MSDQEEPNVYGTSVILSEAVWMAITEGEAETGQTFDEALSALVLLGVRHANDCPPNPPLTEYGVECDINDEIAGPYATRSEAATASDVIPAALHPRVVERHVSDWAAS